jgi:Holliday junction resolvase RusA-like endonuclease
MPKSWSKKKREQMHGKPHQQKPDVDNFAKAVLDALFEDDSHIHDIRVSKIWGHTGAIIVEEAA